MRLTCPPTVDRNAYALLRQGFQPSANQLDRAASAPLPRTLVEVLTAMGVQVPPGLCAIVSSDRGRASTDDATADSPPARPFVHHHCCSVGSVQPVLRSTVGVVSLSWFASQDLFRQAKRVNRLLHPRSASASGLKSCFGRPGGLIASCSAPTPLNDAQPWGLWERRLGGGSRRVCCAGSIPSFGYDGSIPSSPLLI